MPTFAQPQRMNQLGKTDRWLVNYLTFACVLFVLCYAGTHFMRSDYYTQGIVTLLAMIAVLKAFSVPTVQTAYGERALVFLSLMLVVALVNIVVSWSMLESALRWTLWFTMVLSLSRVTSASDGAWADVMIRRLPFLFFCIYTSIIISAHFLDPQAAYAAYHLSGLYGNLILATGLFAGKTWQRLLWSVVGLLAIYFSGAGGALFCIPIMFVPYILYSASSMPVKGLALAGLLALGALSFFESQLFSSFLAIKANSASTGFSYTGLDRLEHSKEMRLQLVEYGLQLVKQNPLGTGLGHTYYDDMFKEAGAGHAHNGTISMLIELGVPGFSVALCLMLWMFSCILRNPSLGSQVRAFYFTYFFTIFGRSLSENYTPLDLGNYFNYIFLVYSGYLFLNQKARPLPSGGLVRQRGRMMMRPGPRAPLPRPVGSFKD